MHRRLVVPWIVVALSLAMGAGCTGGGGGGTASAPGSTQSLTVVEPAGIAGVDTLELEGFDAAGNRIFGPTLAPLGPQTLFQDLPDAVVRVQIDYLRNGGFLLFRAELALPVGETVLFDPQEVAVEPNESTFALVEGPDGFAIERTLTGAPVSRGAVRGRDDGQFQLEGVCYSPAPLNSNNKNGPAFGDLFWDTFEAAPGATIFNWYALWGRGALGDSGFSARDDLGRIRALGANALRTYSFISRQINLDGSIPAPSSGHHFLHQQFLDMCWNNGNDPIYVIVGIPVPETVLYRYLSQPAPTAFWEAVIAETAADVGRHPAVMGFTLHNEIDENLSAYPPGGANADSDFYYGKLKAYSDIIKAAAPGKLVGWAAHDAPPQVTFGGSQPNPGPTYFEQLTSIDFYGVNTYQTLSLTSLTGNEPGSFAGLTGAARKPVLLTEIGWPATGHRDPGDRNSIYEDAETRARTAEVIGRMVPLALNDPLILGAFYFEYCDEWWKQPGQPINAWNGTDAPPTTFPNSYWDEEGFGLYSIGPGPGRTAADDPWAGSGPRLPVDTQTERTEMTRALREAFTSN